LKHIERSGLLVHLIEPEPVDGTDPIENYFLIRNELQKYNPRLTERPELTVVTKADLPAAAPVAQALAEKIGGEVHLISSASGLGIDRLIRAIHFLLTKSENSATSADKFPISFGPAGRVENSNCD
jgi:GTP-binding protein